MRNSHRGLGAREGSASVARRAFRAVRDFLSTPRTDPAIVEEHRRAVLWRAEIGAWIAALVIPFNIFIYVGIYHPRRLGAAGLLTLGLELAVAAFVVALRAGAFRRHFHLTLFVLGGVICNAGTIAVLELAGGGENSEFLFPYFLILFGLATLFPSRFTWMLAAVCLTPLSYALGEILAGRDLAAEKSFTQLIMLTDSAFIAAIANRVTTRLFFGEVENRMMIETVNKQLLELDKSKSDFFANISHDLRSPLTAILGPLQTVVADAASGLSEGQRRFLELALRSAARLERMIDDVLELARIDAGVAKVNYGRVNLREMLEDLVRATEPYANSLGIHIRYEGPVEPVHAVVDGDKIERVAMNLLFNACKYSGPDSTVVLTLEDQGDNVAIRVVDQGVGIPAEDSQKIFERFVRGKSGLRRGIRGQGLGLAVVKEFVELHGGKVTLHSQMAVGSRFTVSLPAQPAGWVEALDQAPVVRSKAPASLLVPELAETRASVPANEQALNLVLAEDSDEVRRYVRAELADSYRVVEAVDGEDALRLAAERGADIVVADVVMPGIDGIELCRRLRSRPATAEVPILLFSARSDVKTRLDAFAAGADDFVHKPFDPQELRARLKALQRRAPNETGVRGQGPGVSK